MVSGNAQSEEVPSIRVRINAKLVRIPERVIVAGSNFENLQVPTANRIDTIMQSFDVALGEVLESVVEWTLRTGQTAYA